MRIFKAMEVIPIFAVPVVVSDEYVLSASELATIKGLPMRSDNAGGNKASADTYVLNLPELAGLKAFLLKQVETYGHGLLKIPRKNPLYITQSWTNVNEKGVTHHLHAHQNSIISGSYYVDGDEVPILFRRPPTHWLFANTQFAMEEYNPFNAADYAFPNRRYRAVLFPSTTPHMVQANTSDKPRISLAFNTFVRGTLGTAEGLDELHL